MMRAALILCALLSGCATPGDFTNRLAPTIAGDRVLVVSWWKWFGIATELDAMDAAEIERLRKLSSGK